MAEDLLAEASRVLPDTVELRRAIHQHPELGLNLPRTQAARASWNYDADDATGPTVTYYLNRLQRLDTDLDYCVTLNRSDAIDPSRIILRTLTDHPLFTPETLTGQQALTAVSGQRRTAYAGAHLGNGFHEDGLASGVRAAMALGVDW